MRFNNCIKQITPNLIKERLSRFKKIFQENIYIYIYIERERERVYGANLKSTYLGDLFDFTIGSFHL